jgi:hypothetical protein
VTHLRSEDIHSVNKAPKNEEFKAFNELYLTGVMEWLLTFNAKLIARHPRNKEARLKAGLYYADF